MTPKSDMLNIEKIFVLQMLRNSFANSEYAVNGNYNDENGSGNDADQKDFYLFDYFDKLIVRKETDQKKFTYRDCFGLSDTNVQDFTHVASKNITLAQIKNDESSGADEDPFFFKEPGLSFLSLIFIDIFYETPKKIEVIKKAAAKSEGVTETAAVGIAAFISACEKDLRNIVKKEITKINENPINENRININVVYEIYNSLNTGNFCLAIRSNVAGIAYALAARINGQTINENNNGCFPPVVCSTYTTIGMEKYKQGEIIGNNTLAFLDMDAAVLLRVSFKYAKDLFEIAALFRHGDANNNNNKTGLLGRYDLRIYLSFSQFYAVYPLLCAIKLDGIQKKNCGIPKAPVDILKEFLPKDAINKNPALETFCIKLINNEIAIVNERLFFDTELFHSEIEGDIQTDNEFRQKIYAQNCSIAEAIGALAKIKFGNYYYDSEFNYCLQLIKNLWESYCNLRVHVDSYISGSMFYIQISLLLQAVKSITAILTDENNRYDKSNHFYNQLFANIRRAVNSINSFHLYLQSINRHSLQAPNYEIGVKMDMEKYLVAYTEFSSCFRRCCAEINKEQKKIKLPILTIDESKSMFQVAPLFMRPYQIDKKIFTAIDECDDDLETNILAISARNNESLCKPFSNIPLLCHEISHDLRYQERSERNEVLAQLIFEKVSYYLVHNLFYYAEYFVEYIVDAEYINVLAKAISDVFINNYIKWQNNSAPEIAANNVFSYLNIGALISNIRQFLLEYVFDSCELNASVIPDNAVLDQYIKCIQNFAAMLEPIRENGEPNETLESLADVIELINKGQLTKNAETDQLEASKFEELFKPVIKARESIIIQRVFTYTAQLNKFYLGLISEVMEIEGVSCCISDKHKKAVYDDCIQRIEKLRKTDDIVAQEKQINDLEDRMQIIIQDKTICTTVIDKLEIAANCLRMYKNKLAECKDLFNSLNKGEDIEHFNKRIQSFYLNNNAAALTKYIKAELLTKPNMNRLEMLEGTLKNFCMELKDINTLTAQANKCMIIIDEMHDKANTRELKENIIKEIFFKCQESLFLFEKDNRRSIINNSRLANSRLVLLGLWNKEPDGFNHRLHETIKCISAEKIKAIIDETVTLYREMFADLNMCITIGINGFGYLKLAAYNNCFYENIEAAEADVSSSHSLVAERILYVTRILMQLYPETATDNTLETATATAANTALNTASKICPLFPRQDEKLKELCLTYIGMLLKYQLKKLPCALEEVQDLRIKQETSGLRKNCCHYLLSIFNSVADNAITVNNNVTASVKDFINDLPQACDLDRQLQQINYKLEEIRKRSPEQAHELLNIEHEIYGLKYLTELITMVSTMPIDNHERLIVSFAGMFKKIKNEISESEEYNQFLNQEISQFYNDIHWQSIQETEDKKTKTALEFVLYYYYHNWYTYHNCLQDIMEKCKEDAKENDKEKVVVSMCQKWLMGVK